MGNLFLPPNRQKTARPISQALAPQWCWSASVCISVRERGTTIEIQISSTVTTFHCHRFAISFYFIRLTPYLSRVFEFSFSVGLTVEYGGIGQSYLFEFIARMCPRRTYKIIARPRGNCILIDRSTKRKLHLCTP